MKVFKIRSYAKINLALAILNKRKDGYHNINSIMQTVSLYDIVKLKKNKKIICKTNDISIPNDDSNLAVKAAKAFFSFLKINSGAKISIKKKIPTNAGLAGGSSNAASVLIGLNVLYNTKLPNETLLKISSKIGSDVPFLISGGTAFAEGKGEILTQLPTIKDYIIWIAKPNFNVSTKKAYEEYDKLTKFKTNSIESLKLKIIENKKIDELTNHMFNDFEKIFNIPIIDQIKKIMLMNNALSSLMTGSGSAIFGIFKNFSDAKNAKKMLKKQKLKTFICVPIKKY